MPLSRNYISAVLLVMLSYAPGGLSAAAIDNAEAARKQLFENQRNIILLRKEMATLLQELQQAQTTDQKNALNIDIDDTRDSIAVANSLISNISKLVAQQRQQLSTIERGKPPTALDIALNKALNSNLPELIKNLSNNKEAKKEVTRLKRLLKEQALLGRHRIPVQNDRITVTSDQQKAEDEFLRLLALFSSGTADNAEDKIVEITGSNFNVVDGSTEILSYLGHRQYHMETTVYQGQMTFLVDDHPWELNVSKKDDQATFVMIYDLRNEKPRLVMFNKSLID